MTNNDGNKFDGKAPWDDEFVYFKFFIIKMAIVFGFLILLGVIFGGS